MCYWTQEAPFSSWGWRESKGERAPQSNPSLDRRTVEMEKQEQEGRSERQRVRNEQLKLTIEDFPFFL